MNLWIRFARVVFLAWWAPRADLSKGSNLAFRVWPHDLDINMHVNNGRYLTLMDLGRVDILARTGLMREMMRRRWMPVVAGIQISFRKSLGLLQKFRLRTQILGWEEKWFYIGQEFWVGEVLYARALVKAAICDEDGRLPSAKILALLGTEPTPPVIDEVWSTLIEREKNS
jgi:YbgC/YbaW family acyl-CoA thioester hydrolase